MRGLALACLLAAASNASASGLQIAPTSLALAPGGPAQALWLTNTGDHELRAQVRAYHWSQAGGHDALEATQALVASPPMLDIPPGGRQLVRVIRTGQDDARPASRPSACSSTSCRSATTKGRPACSTCCAIRCRSSSASAARLRCNGRGDSVTTGSSSTVRNGGTAHAQILGLNLVPPGARTGRARAGSARLRAAGRDDALDGRAACRHERPTNASLKALINGEPTDQTLSPGAPSR